MHYYGYTADHAILKDSLLCLLQLMDVMMDMELLDCD
jgi:hypothetical protein